MKRLGVCLWAALTVAVAPAVSPQAPVAVRLAPPDATLREEFARIASVRELRDGRVLISDGTDKRLVVADLRTGAVAQIGRVGGGPGEYSTPGSLTSLPNDSTLLVAGDDPPRLLMMSGARITGTISSTDRLLQLAGLSLLGSDARGRLLGRLRLAGVKIGGDATRGMGAIVLVDRSQSRSDTVVRLRGDEFASRVVTMGGKKYPAIFQVVFSVPDQAVLYPDGWIAVAYQDPYQVAWHSPTGRTTTGASLGWTPVKVTESEKAAYLSRLRQRLGASTKIPDGMPWAETVPPFQDDALLAAPDGRLLVRRMQWSGAPNTNYDIVDRTGRRVGSLALPWNEHIVGFGARSVYVVVADSDGIERLRRHPWNR